MKIFITIGTQAPFDRLVRIVQEFADSHCTEVFIQDMDSMLTEKDLEARMQWADVIVAHAGIGTLIKARSIGKRLIIMPRLARLGEQRNEHQLDTCAFVREYRLAEVAESKEELFLYLESIIAQLENRCLSKNYEFPQKSRPFVLNFNDEKVMAVSSYGGHTVELNQCLLLSGISSLVRVCTCGDCDYLIDNFSRVDIWKIGKVMRQMWNIINKVHPDVVVSTGAAPGLVAIIIAWALDIKTIWIDSAATRKKLSLSGKLVKPFCSEYYVQWPELVKGKTKYNGNVLGI